MAKFRNKGQSSQCLRISGYLKAAKWLDRTSRFSEQVMIFFILPSEGGWDPFFDYIIDMSGFFHQNIEKMAGVKLAIWASMYTCHVRTVFFLLCLPGCGNVPFKTYVDITLSFLSRFVSFLLFYISLHLQVT